jgi:hypothetical protein
MIAELVRIWKEDTVAYLVLYPDIPLKKLRNESKVGQI